MRNPRFSILFVTTYLLVYAIVASFTDYFQWALIMFIFSPILILWMVYTVLKYGKPSNKTFDEHFYEDFDYRKIPDYD